ncbi:MBL fold metallo-hydrolase [Planomicrobium sp. YIM 101495]|uniref:MBL fold metallo-hydrolase n=1 Tax=Planomicrobium sp. YIM 101495 TaxID=2665160 RepID=UPI0013F95368|nr:MBL fold metallo-hydrolase [Planomicrobium sp. YIM 101495]
MFVVDEKEGVVCAEMSVEKMGKVYVFFVDGMLVDAGPQLCEKELIAFYNKYPIDQVVLTHNHEDHTGTAPWLQQQFGIPIFVHPKGLTECSEDTPYPEYRIQTWGRRAPFEAQPLESVVSSRSRNWQVIETPGHARDHVAFYDGESKVMFTGDLYVNPRTKVIMRDESIPQIMQSIRKLLEYEFTSIFCSHAGYVENGRSKLEEKLAYLENLSAQLKRMHGQGMTVEEIREELFPKRYPIIAFSGTEWDSMHIVTSILANQDD